MINYNKRGGTHMAISLTKGGKISLTKDNPNLNNIVVGLGWDARKKMFGPEFDLDASAYLLGEDKKCAGNHDLVYYGNKRVTGVMHSGDNLTGEGDGDDEQIRVSLQEVPSHIHRIAFTVDIYQAKQRKQTFTDVKNAYIRVFDEKTGNELVRFNLGNDFGKETAVVAGELYRHNGEWKFNAVGMGYEDGRNSLQRAFMR